MFFKLIIKQKRERENPAPACTAGMPPPASRAFHRCATVPCAPFDRIYAEWHPLHGGLLASLHNSPRVTGPTVFKDPPRVGLHGRKTRAPGQLDAVALMLPRECRLSGCQYPKVEGPFNTCLSSPPQFHPAMCDNRRLASRTKPAHAGQNIYPPSRRGVCFF